MYVYNVQYIYNVQIVACIPHTTVENLAVRHRVAVSLGPIEPSVGDTPI